ncbi:putative mannose-resistant/Proteus-like fimbrial protein [Yersinia aldovae]|uniref:fimbrial protein n=1 Tax=Yersinia aldovae TaxID=29483 RepID=UPI0005EA5018|nr:fimbrial protein [Yersinia aldovae]CNG96668.1 putative mannose-resistant/Proteus-like fimbrial protein [Yersinia aldovae]
MKNIITALVLGLGVSSMAHAADGTINFTGNIIEQACDITSGVAGTQTVNLGNIAKSNLSGAGKTSGSTKFSIVLADCPVDFIPTSVSVKFDGTSVAADTSLLALTAGQTATGVGVQILEADGNTPVPLRTASVQQTLVSGGTTTLDFVARYKAVAVATAGTANASTTFVVDYN